MGGVKKKTMAAMEKSQDSTETAQSGGEEQKGRKAKEQKAPPLQQKKFAFLPPKMADQDMVKALAPLKAITLASASRALAVNGSVASGLLQSLEQKNLITRVGGFSGHYVWTVQPKQA